MVCQQVTITLHRYREVYFGVLNSIKIVRNQRIAYARVVGPEISGPTSAAERRDRRIEVETFPNDRRHNKNTTSSSGDCSGAPSRIAVRRGCLDTSRVTLAAWLAALRAAGSLWSTGWVVDY